MAWQIHAGLSGMRATMQAPKANNAPYAEQDARLPGSLRKALEMLNSDLVFCTDFGVDFVRYLNRIKGSEMVRFETADDKDEWQRREYFGRI